METFPGVAGSLQLTEEKESRESAEMNNTKKSQNLENVNLVFMY